MSLLLIIFVAIVVIALLGWVVLGLVFKLLWWAVIGLFIGAIARLVLPGRQPIGILMTVLDGIAGALLGGVVATAANLGALLQFIIAVAAAAVLVAVTSASAQHGARSAAPRR